MTVDRAWVKRNLGFDPIETPAPQNTFAMRDQAHVAAQIYKGFGPWSTVCSAIVCWALIAAE
jgi:hypothetical protein